MKLDCIVAACNLNPLYSDFIPLFIRAWSTLYPKTDIKIILIADEIPEQFAIYTDNIIVYTPLLGVSTSFTSQYIRLLYPCILDYDGGIMITDIDMLPMNSTYYTENIRMHEDSKFVYLRNACFDQFEIAMCYNVGLSKTWADIFNIRSVEDIHERLISVSNRIIYLEGHGNVGWNTDQRDFYSAVVEWNNRTHGFVYLDDMSTGFLRLDRIHQHTIDMQPELQVAIRAGVYSDYHCLRPYNDYKQANDTIVWNLENRTNNFT